MNKRGMEMTMGIVISMILGLIILVILIIFVQQQFAKTGKRYGEFEKEAEISPEKCQSIILGRYCVLAGKCVDTTGKSMKIDLPPGTTQWADCGNQKDPKLKDKPECCPVSI